MTGSLHLVVGIGDALFALPGEAVTGVVEPVPVSPVPFVPDHVEGIVALRGAVLPQIDLAGRLGRRHEGDASELVRLATAAGEVALRVGRVHQLVSDAPAAEAADGPDRLTAGAIAWEGRAVPVLDPDAVADLDAPAPPAAGPREPLGIVDEPNPDAATVAQEIRLVVESAGRLYGLPPGAAHEVMALDRLMPLPGAPRHVLGLVSLRGELLPLLSFPGLLGLGEAGAPPENLVVLGHGGGCFALAVDRLHGLWRLAAAGESVPGLPAPVSTVLAGADGRLVAGVDLDALIGAGLARFVATLASLDGIAARAGGTDPVPTARLVTFTVGPRVYALPVERIERVLRGHALDGLDWGEDRAMHGVVEVRGRVLPATDLRMLLDGGRPEPSEPPGMILVVRAETGDSWAFAVDAVVDVIDVPTAGIDRLVATGNRMVAGVARHGEDLIWLLSLEPFLGETP